MNGDNLNLEIRILTVLQYYLLINPGFSLSHFGKQHSQRIDWSKDDESCDHNVLKLSHCTQREANTGKKKNTFMKNIDRLSGKEFIS